MKDNELILQFLTSRLKTFDDLDNLSNYANRKHKTKEDRINYILIKKSISSTTIQRVFNIGYLQAKSIMSELLKANAVDFREDSYNILISPTKIKEILNKSV